jgi:DHA1 family multidrug resistance protein-like MFS transporter
MSAPTATRGRPALVAILVAAGITDIAYTMLVPLVPELTHRFGMNEPAVGVAFAGFAFAKALAQPAGGLLTDRLPGRLTVLAVGWLTLAALAIAAVGFTRSGTELVVLRLAWGAAEGLAMPPLYRLLVTLGHRTGLGSATAFGWFGGAAVSGMALGPVLVGLLHPVIGFTGVFLVGAGFTLASAVLVGATARSAAGDAAPEAGEPAPVTLPRGLVVGLVAVFGLSDLVNNAIYAALEPTLPLHIERIAGNALGVTSILFTLGLVVFAVVSPVSGHLVERAPLLVVGAAAFAVSAAGLAGQSVAASMWPLGGAFLLFMLTQPVLYVVARRGIGIVPEHALGRVFGMFGLLSDAGFIAGPLVGALLFVRLGSGAFAVLAGAAAVMAVALFTVRSFPARVEAALTPQERDIS